MWRISVVLLMCLVADPAFSNPPVPTPSKPTEQPETNSKQHEETTATDQRGTENSPVFIKVTPPLSVQPQPSKETENHRDYTSSEWWLVYITGALVMATIGLMIYTAKLWGSTNALAKDAKGNATRQAGEMQETLRIARESAKVSRDAADISHDAMVAGERAFVFAINVQGQWTHNKTTGLYDWRLCPIWQNSGDTPTKGMIMHTACILRDTLLPTGFNFDDPMAVIGTALIPPRTTGLGGRAPDSGISPQDIRNVQEGKQILYMWGWARYYDVFKDTPRHITRFCWYITPHGDPMTFTPEHPNTISWPSIHHTEGNCADDECTQS